MVSESRIVTEQNARELAEWCGGKLVTEYEDYEMTIGHSAINVPVGEGSVERARIGSLIIKKDDGTFGVFV